MKRSICIAVTACLIASASFGQAAHRIDKILETQKATFGQAAYLILTASENGSDGIDFETAFEQFKTKNQDWLPNTVTAEDAIPAQTYAFLLMKAFNIKGGMMYRIYPCPRYAYRDLRYLAIIQGKNNPEALITGASMLQIFSRIDTVQGGEQ